jgi:N-methylhydantoinase B
VVDVVFGALAIACPHLVPAASHGSMNNIAMGSNAANWHYYETIAGGAGAGPVGPGANAIHTHMTNTLNTPLESLETHYPLRLRRYQIRTNSGGQGLHPGGDGVIREIELLRPAEMTLLTERRNHQPWGLQGGHAGAIGENRLNGELLPAKCHRQLQAGDIVTISTPGGGGWGIANRTKSE